MGCTMSIEVDKVFPALLLVLAVCIFINYILNQLINGSKKAFKISLFFIAEVIIVVLLLGLFSLCPDGCDTSCPTYILRPFMLLMIFAMIIRSVKLVNKYFSNPNH